MGAWVIFLSGTAAAALQTSSPSIPVEEMARSAEVIGVAQVRSAQPRKDSTTGLIYTDFSLAFSEIWKGSPAQPFVMVKAGGTLEGRTSAILGREYKLEVGQSVVVFATRSQRDAYAVMGLRQGLYRMGGGPDPLLFRVSEFPDGPGASSDLRLGKLRDQVFRILGRPVGSADGSAPGTAPEEPREGKVPGGAAGPVAPTPAANPPSAEAPPSQRPVAGIAVLFGVAVIGLVAFAIIKRKTGNLA